MKKKLFSIFIAVLIAASSLVFAAPVSADTTLPVFSVSNVDCKVGQAVEVFLHVENGSELSAGNVFIYYDTTQLKYIQWEEAKSLKNTDLLAEGGFAEVKNCISAAFMALGNRKDNIKNFDIVRFVFVALKEGKSDITVELSGITIGNDSTNITSQLTAPAAKINIGSDVEPKNVVDLGTTNPPETAIPMPKANTTKAQNDGSVSNEDSEKDKPSAINRLVIIVCIIILLIVAYYVYAYIKRRKEIAGEKK